MRNYELTLLLRTGLGEAEHQELLGQVSLVLQDAGALIMGQDSRGKRVLPSLIKKQREAELAVIKFALDPAKLESVEKNLREKEAVVRFSLLSYLPRKTEGRTIEKSAAPGEPREAQTQAQKVEIEDIDKKLEEIFKDENL